MESYDIEEVLKNIFDCNETNWKPADKIPLLTKEIELLKIDLKSYLETCEYNVDSVLEESKILFVDSKAVVDELEKCKKEIEEHTMAEVLKSIETHDQITKELQHVNFALNIVYDVGQCGKLVKQFEEGRQAQSYTRAVEAVYDLLQYIELPAEGFKYLDIYANTKHTAQLILDKLLQDLYTEWTRLVSWNTKVSSKKSVVKITLKIEDTPFVIDVIRALDKNKNLKEKVSEFSQFLYKEVLQPIIYNDCIVFPETEELLTVTINYKQNYKPPYDQVIANFRLLFHHLSSKLKFEYDKNCSIMKLIGNEISGPFSELIMKDCFIDTIPNNIIDLQTYGKITSEIEKFQHFLFIVKFFTEDISILKYIEDIDILFSKKSSDHFLKTARDIMLKDLSVCMSIGVENISDEEESSDDYGKAAEALRILEKTIPKSLFYFPRCMISKTAQELLDLIYVIMEQAVQCSDVVCKKLYQTTRLIFELYDAVMPYHHEKYLQTIPQYVALFHNNCMYLAHNMMTFGDKWLTLMEGRDIDYPIGFVDLVQKLRELGYKHLTIHLQQQRKQILDNIRSSDLNCMVVKEVLGSNAEAAIRQCLRQLQLLKNVWIGVFPINVFTRLMATLVNMFIEELIHRVCTVEDISMEMATQLTEIYTLVVQKAPQLFQSSTDIETHVKSWIKLQELIFVLGGSLKDIDNHWKDGTGPLAVHFRTEELRNLIKALFQNTQIRANLLSKIK
ncbi:centromere/kinetochore protein zw10 homolog [Bombyx mori]|uniref:Centromere/kinetochore protein zw10-like protein n=1 Tax=Bombyx mori TaxID=7091 RepID=A0A8R2C507_BOMMO|nr:centromere/kinetochore protein zw10 homolog [Bombyx mori]XP_012543905.1 centromere/kinetochore protein zw10 homolog [Bombyx mori]XP_012543906.1 centromere/kinetochore protein zw10 homolog [Bombyx mori]